MSTGVSGVQHAVDSHVRDPFRVRHVLASVSATLFVSGLIVILAVVARGPAAYAAQPAVGLGTATSFAVLAGSTVTNTGPSVVSGDLGVSPGAAVTGFPPGLVVGGTTHAADAVALQAQNDLTTAYNDAAGRIPVIDKTGQDLGGATLLEGVYGAATGMALTGTVTLDAKGKPGAVFIFQAGSTLITASGSRVALSNGAQACNVFWQVGSSATIGTNTTFAGTIMALASITLQNGATVAGRALARNGAVTMDNNVITRPTCAAAPPPPPPPPPPPVPTTATATVSPTGTGTPTGTAAPSGTAAPTGPAAPTGTVRPTGTAAPTGTSSVGPGPGGPDGPGSPTDESTNPGAPRRPPWVPIGHPPTGQVSAPLEQSQAGLWLGGGLCLAGAAFGIPAVRRPRSVRPE